MPRSRHTIRPARLNATIPEDLKAKLDLKLFSAFEGRVPYGEYTKFLTRSIQIEVEWAKLDLSLFLPALPPGSELVGPPPAIAALEALLLSLSPNQKGT